MLSSTLQSAIQQPKRMHKKVEEQTRTIEYIKKLYKEKTGEEIVMPMSWEESLGLAEEEAPSIPFPLLGPDQDQGRDFRLALDSLSLPTRISASKPPLTSFSAGNRFHMIEHIDLSGFREQGFTKQLLREFLSRIVEMRALSSLSLKDNGIDDSCAQEIETLFANKKITRIDLASNKMGKSCLQIITKNFGHVEWIDLCRNYFLFETYALQQFLSAVRLNGKIHHLSIDLHDPRLVTQLCGFMKIKPHMHSLALVDTHIDAESMGLICKVLEEAATAKKEKEVRINYLNFSFCYLERPVFSQLLKALSMNTTLVSLNLSSNNLGEGAALTLCKTLESSLSLLRVNLAGNLLEDEFALGLAQCLEKNQILQLVDISKNNIGQAGGKALFDVLSNKNDSLESFGPYETNERMGQELIQKIRKALKINKVSKQIRSKIISEQANLSAVQISNRQTEAFLQAQYDDFDILVPIAVSNPIKQDPNMIHIWNFQ